MKGLFTFSPRERLKKRAQFRKVYKEGRPVKGDNFKLIFLPNGLEHNRTGLSIEARKIPLQVRRARVKRLLREAVRLNKGLLKQGFDMVVISGPDAYKLNFDSTEKELMSLFKKGRLLKEI